MTPFATYQGWQIARANPGVLVATREGREAVSGNLADVMELIDEIEEVV